MNYVDLVAILAIIQFLFFGSMVGRARQKYGVKAPAVSGHELFERAYRVQMNTLELLIAFLPALLIASTYWPQSWVAIVGAVYLIGRFVYWRSYTADPASRALGFALSILPVLVLILLALAGITRGITPA